MSAIEKFGGVRLTPETLRSVPGEDWLCAPLLKSASSHSITAEGGAGKSLLALEMALAIALGRPALGHGADDPKRVLYLDFEMGKAKYERRAREMGVDVGHRDVPNLIYVQGLRQLPSMDEREGADGLIEMVDETAADLVVIDTLSKAVLGDESNNSVFSRFARYALGPLAGMGVAVLLLDHEGKSKKGQSRGASAKRDNVDFNYILKRQKGGTKHDLIVVEDKNREGSSEDSRRVVAKLHRQDEPVLRHWLPDGHLRPKVRAAVDFIDLFIIDNERMPTYEEVSEVTGARRNDIALAKKVILDREAA